MSARALAILLPVLLFVIPAAAQTLPAEWEGLWKGTTVRALATGEKEEIPTELHVQPLPGGGDARTWKIVYGGQEARPYEISPVPGQPGRFVVDEKNGLLIDQQLVGNTLYALFLVTTNLVSARYEHLGDGIEVELTMFDAREPRKSKLTGGEIEVSSYRVRSVQRGTLTRQMLKTVPK